MVPTVKNSIALGQEQSLDRQNSESTDLVTSILKKFSETGLNSIQFFKHQFNHSLFFKNKASRHLYLFDLKDARYNFLKNHFPHYQIQSDVETKMESGMILHECGCDDFSRIGTFCNPTPNDRRDRLEKKVVENLQKIQPKKDETISILSLGAAGMLQEYRVLSTLLLDGYSDIHLICVDPAFKSEEEKGCVVQVKKLLQCFPNIRIDAFQTISEIPSDLNFHQVMAIDYDCYEPDCLRDLVKAQTHLEPSGQTVLAFRFNNLMLSSDFHFSSLDDTATSLFEQVQSLKEALPKGKKSWKIFFDTAYDREFSAYLFLLIGTLNKLETDQLPNKVQVGFRNLLMNSIQTIQDVFKMLYPRMNLKISDEVLGYDMAFGGKSEQDKTKQMIALDGGTCCFLSSDGTKLTVEAVASPLKELELD